MSKVFTKLWLGDKCHSDGVKAFRPLNEQLPGLYDDNDILIVHWNDLIDKYGFDCERNYASSSNFSSSSTHPSTVLSNDNVLKQGTKLIIGNDISNIGSYAFSTCNTLTHIIIPSTVTAIQLCAFNKSSIQRISISNSVKSIGQNSFVQCNKLKYVTLPNKLTEIASYVFYGCNCLESVDIPNSVTRIGISAFHNSKALKQITIPESVEYIDNYVFSACKGLRKVTFRGTPKFVSATAFNDCSNIEFKVPWSENSVPNEVVMWGATNSSMEYNCAEEEVTE